MMIKMTRQDAALLEPRLRRGFETAFKIAVAPQEAALFRSAPVNGEVRFYITPAGAKLVKASLGKHRLERSAPPRLGELTLIAGDPVAPRRASFVKEDAIARSPGVRD